MPLYFSLAELETILKDNLLEITDSNSDLSIFGITTDTRIVKPQELFIALVGEKFDGHSFVEQAVDKGAIALIVNRHIELTVPQFIVKDTLKAYQQIAQWWRDRFRVTNSFVIT